VSDALLAAALFAVDPAGTGGISVRGRWGPVRDEWLAALVALMPERTPVRRVPSGITDDRLLGGLDLAATLQARRPVIERGLLAEADGGVILLPMAERLSPTAVARLTAVLDTGEVVVERDGISVRHATRLGVVAFDEGIGEDERLPPSLVDRLAFAIDLTDGDIEDAAWTRADVENARARVEPSSPYAPAASRQPRGRTPRCLPSSASRMRAFWSPYPGSAINRW